MEYVLTGIKVFIFLSIINVWFFRFNKATTWRGGSAKSMKEEFEVYGLSETLMYLVGALKVISAILILASIWFPSLTIPAAGTMAVLMAGAISMHVKVQDPIKRSFPAFSFLVLSVVLIFAG
ncbi:DoxX-like family protein [Robiginitalea myxolifaciens]|uniref:DoxX-like family protein n=1 Tax=Robiginitalea myxolifaciens TaxID=400055 RepID=A0A1I6H1C9_9FLAO|nr:DoxX family protein [Robiginitalea myxolifaciens]SFR48250.1 DoxX-like family protein [Robiginitalea myxolifaciens]